jgi:hypothetical protein
MRNTCVLALLFAIATIASAEEYGPIKIEQLSSLGMPRIGAYYEYRFLIRNASAQQHTVRIDVNSMVFLAMPGQSHAVRQFTIGPRSSESVSIPDYIAGPGAGTSETTVTIDGREQRPHFSITKASPSSLDHREHVLIGRNVPSQFIPSLIDGPEPAVSVRADIPPGDWSDQWVQYARFDGALFTPTDWGEMPPPVRAALLRWVSAGGAIIFFGLPDHLPQLRPANEITQFSAGHYGFGTIVFAGNAPDLTNPMAVSLRELRAQWQRSPMVQQPLDQINGWMPILDNNGAPVGAMFSLLVVFAVAGGPVSLYMLAKRDRRIWIFAAMPVLAIATAAIIVGALVFSEGWVRVQKGSSLTLLDETRGEATTIGWTGIYSTFAPNGTVRFETNSEVRPFFYPKDAVTDWSDGQRLVSGWIASRVPSQFALRKVEARRERVPIRIENGTVYALNGLGVPIQDLGVATADGAMYRAQHVPAGKEVALTPMGHVSPKPKDPASLYGPWIEWHSFAGRVSKEMQAYLTPGTYIAVINRSPFVERALARATKSTSNAVVIGRSAHAS